MISYKTYIWFLRSDLHFFTAIAKIMASTTSINSNPADAKGRDVKKSDLLVVPELQLLVAMCTHPALKRNVKF